MTMHPVFRFLLWLDRAVNGLTGGSFHRTLSARAHLTARNGHKYWGWTERFINQLFFWDENHCKNQWEQEEKIQYSPMTVREAIDTIIGGLVFVFLALGGIHTYATLMV